MKQNRNIPAAAEREHNARLVRDLTDVCPANESRALAAWRAADPAHEAQYARLRSYWNARVSSTVIIDPQREFRKLQQRIDGEQTPPRTVRKRLPATHLKRYATMAAMLAAGLFGGWMLSGVHSGNQRYTFLTSESVSSFELPDGSRITLNRESRLDYDSRYGRSERRVQLVGEGYFEVRKQADRRFVVEMGDVEVAVLGTTFDAGNRPEEGLISAALVEGSVEFRAGNQNLRLTPSRRAVYDVGSGEITVSAFDPEITTAWKDNLFRYKSLTLEEIMELLSARYDVRIIVDASDYGQVRFSGALERDLSIEQVLGIVSRQAGIRWSRHDGVYFIAKR